MKENHRISLIRSGQHPLTVVNTDLAEAEELVRHIAEKDRQAYPEFFAGEEPCIYFKMPYIQPCDRFQELRRLILRVREHTGLRALYKGIIAIEASQWIGHEREEYFTVLLKYLYDHRDTWQAVIVLNDCKPPQLQKFLSACAKYMTPRSMDIRLFHDEKGLCDLIRSEFQKYGSHISHAAASMIASVMGNPELKDVRSLSLIARTAADMIAYCGDPPQITAGHAKNYLLDGSTMLALLAGKILYNERSTNGEEESLHL